MITPAKETVLRNFTSVEDAGGACVRGEEAGGKGTRQALRGVRKRQNRAFSERKSGEESRGQILEGLRLSCFRVWALSFRYFLAQWTPRDMLGFLFWKIRTGVKGHPWERGRGGASGVALSLSQVLSPFQPSARGARAWKPSFSLCLVQ